MNKDITLTIDGQSVSVPASVSIWTAAQKVGIRIPTLCHHFDLEPYAGCRVCVVEVKGARTLVAACAYPVSEGMVVMTNTSKVREARKLIIELLLADHPKDCLTCDRSQNCELQKLALEFGIKEVRFARERTNWALDTSNPSIVRDQNKCILCGRCVRVCSDKQSVGAYTFANRGFNSTVTTAFGKALDCTFCGQCVTICPTGALTLKDDTEDVMDAINDPEKFVIVQTAPAVRVALGELFGKEPGSIVTEKMVGALKLLGFDKVFDTNFTADLTIMEEATEFLERFKGDSNMPMITSCCPGWINFLYKFYPDYAKHHSSCKSPQQMFGAVVKTYYAEKMNIDPSKIVSVSIMPCLAKKFEAKRSQMNSSGYQDVDYVLSTRGLERMLKSAGISLNDVQSQTFDSLLGQGSGAGTIFGATGGVMEAALRTAYEHVTGKTLEKLEFDQIRGIEGVREADIDLDGTKIRVAIAHGLRNARKIMESIKAGNPNKWDFIEIMACQGGCIAGGGQPISKDINFRAKRIKGLYTNDLNLKIRKSHENPEIKTIYADYFGTPGSEKAHKLLHTHYEK